MPDTEEATAVAFSRAALEALTPAATIGEPAGETDEGNGAVTHYFAAVLSGYPGWKWAVTIVQLDGEGPTLLETQLMPGDGSLLAPDWIPWSERMDDYRAAQLALGEAAALEGDDEDDDDDDVDDDDLEDGLLHAGDLDGVDIDEVDIDEADIDEADIDEAGSWPKTAAGGSTGAETAHPPPAAGELSGDGGQCR